MSFKDVAELTVELKSEGDLFDPKVLNVKQINELAETMFIPSCCKADPDFINKFVNETIQFKWHFNYEYHGLLNLLGSMSNVNSNNDYRFKRNL